MKIYIGYSRISDTPTILKLDSEPTSDTHGQSYAYFIGPFRTMRGAKYMARYGRNNPHLQHVNDAERLAVQA